jgi:hypothetical protein
LGIWGVQAAELTSYIEQVQKSNDKADVFTEDKLFDLLKKGENEEVVKILTAESTALSNSSEKGHHSPSPCSPRSSESDIDVVGQTLSRHIIS